MYARQEKAVKYAGLTIWSSGRLVKLRIPRLPLNHAYLAAQLGG